MAEITKTTPEQNRALVMEGRTLFNKRDYAAAERFWSPDYIHTARISHLVVRVVHLIKSVPPTLKYEPGMIVAEGDLVIVHGDFRTSASL